MLKLFPSLCRPSPRLINIDAPLVGSKDATAFWPGYPIGKSWLPQCYGSYDPLAGFIAPIVHIIPISEAFYFFAYSTGLVSASLYIFIWR